MLFTKQSTGALFPSSKTHSKKYFGTQQDYQISDGEEKMKGKDGNKWLKNSISINCTVGQIFYEKNKPNAMKK